MESDTCPAPQPDGLVRASDIKEFLFQLRQIARNLLAGERQAHSVMPTMLVHSAFYRNTVRDSAWQDVTWASRQHFFADMIRAMRRSLIDRIRRVRALKRPPLQYFRPEDMPIDFSRDIDRRPERVELLDDALELLEEEKPHLARIVYYHYYVGLTVGEIADMLEVDEKTVDRRLLRARMTLHELMTGGRDADAP